MPKASPNADTAVLDVQLYAVYAHQVDSSISPDRVMFIPGVSHYSMNEQA